MKIMKNGVVVELTAEQEAAFEASRQPPPIGVPASVSMAQARKALILGSVTIASVDAAIAAIADDTERALAETDWQYATEVRRNSPLVQSLAPALGLTDAQVDQLFITAAGL